MAAPTTAQSAEFPNAGKPVAHAIYLVDLNGNPLVGTGGLPVQVSNANANGQAIMANSAPVVPASDWIGNVIQKSAAWTNIFSTTQTGVAAWTGSGDLAVGTYSQLAINIQVSAITGTSIQFLTKRKDSFGNYYLIDGPAAITSASGMNRSIGLSAQSNVFFGNIAQIVATLVAITSVTFTVDIWAR